MLLKRPLLFVAIICFSCFFPARSVAKTPQRTPLTKAIKDSLKKEIDAMLVADQKYRWMIMFGEMDETKLAELRAKDDKEEFKRMQAVHDNKIGISQHQKDSLAELQGILDTANFIKLSAIIWKYGFPKKYVAAYYVGAILQHNADLIDDAFLKMLRQEVDNGNMPGSEYAIIYDQVQTNKKLPKLYYVGDAYDDESNNFHPLTPKDKEATNKAREEIGMKKLK